VKKFLFILLCIIISIVVCTLLGLFVYALLGGNSGSGGRYFGGMAVLYFLGGGVVAGVPVGIFSGMCFWEKLGQKVLKEKKC
jgi:ABC-type transport system involved in multi-copper enzyme maturation permease subunit